VSEQLRQLDEFLDGIFLGQGRMTSDEIRRRAVEAELPADLQTRIDALPEGDYAVDEAIEALHGQTV